MPIWHIYTPVGAFSGDDKKTIAAALTQPYVELGQLPKFYVNVLFHEIAAEDFHIGGAPRNNYVRFVGTHIARRLSTSDSQRGFMQVLDAAIAPFVMERGYDWEIHIDETPRELWQVQGLVPPPESSDSERMWLNENRPIPYDTVQP